MTVMMTPPAMPVVMVVHIDHNLRARYWDYRREEG
jgi:hypothetical protein